MDPSVVPRQISEALDELRAEVAQFNHVQGTVTSQAFSPGETCRPFLKIGHPNAEGRAPP